MLAGERRPAWMAKPYSMDLRERVVAAVEVDGAVAASRRRRSSASASARRSTGCSVSRRPAALRRARWAGTSRRRSGASIAPGCGADRGRGLHPARAGGRARRARPEGRLPLGVELRSCREAELQKKPCSPASRIVPTSRAGGRSGSSIRAAIEPERLVFIDETWTKTNMAPLRGWAPRGTQAHRPRSRTAAGRP